jgi:hypothetical protein
MIGNEAFGSGRGSVFPNHPSVSVINLTIIVAFTCRPNVVDVARSRDDTIEADYQEELRDPGR